MKKAMSVASSGERNSFFGKKHSDESKLQMAMSSPCYVGKSNPFYGKHHSEEVRLQIKEARAKQFIKNQIIGIFDTDSNLVETVDHITKLYDFFEGKYKVRYLYTRIKDGRLFGNHTLVKLGYTTQK